MTEIEETREANGPLTGYRVLELGTIIAGPFAGRLLADLGADVIKIESPRRPDPLRTWGQGEVDGHRVFWTVHARNKRCITLDLQTPRGRDLFLDLVERSDVVVENFRPGTLEKWGIGPDELRERNPKLVLARVSGYGQSGPDAHKPGYASVAEGISGFRYINGTPGEIPPRIALSLGDSLAGMFAVQGVLAALLRAKDTGVGDVVDVSLAESCVAVLESCIPDFDAAGIVRQPAGTRLDGIAPSNVYRTKDERLVIIAANQDTVFTRLCAAIERPELATDPRYDTHVARGRHQDDLDEILGPWAAARSADEIIEVLDAAGVVVGPVNTIEETMQNPQLQARGMFVDHYDERVGRAIKGPGIVPKIAGAPGSVRWAGRATPGYDNAAVLGELAGIDADTLDELSTEGII
ncbi:MAG: CaiB/BaiF CoA transferase family protein [Pseudoclavibacter sp.]